MRRVLAITCLLAVVMFSTGCALVRPSTDLALAPTQLWRGRLALRLDTPQPQSFASAFELSGTPGAGELLLTTPWGTTVAQLSWSAQRATWRTPDDTRSFASIDEMMVHTLGSAVPLDALFAWLQGQAFSTSGWSADLSDFASGRITAQRTVPAPGAELRLTLER